MEAKDFADIYEEIAVESGTETAVKIHKLFKGNKFCFRRSNIKKITYITI